MGKILKRSNSKFVVNLFKCLGVSVGVVSCDSCDKSKGQGNSGDTQQAGTASAKTLNDFLKEKFKDADDQKVEEFIKCFSGQTIDQATTKLKTTPQPNQKPNFVQLAQNAKDKEAMVAAIARKNLEALYTQYDKWNSETDQQKKQGEAPALVQAFCQVADNPDYRSDIKVFLKNAGLENGNKLVIVADNSSDPRQHKNGGNPYFQIDTQATTQKQQPSATPTGSAQGQGGQQQQQQTSGKQAPTATASAGQQQASASSQASTQQGSGQQQTQASEVVLPLTGELDKDLRLVIGLSQLGVLADNVDLSILFGKLDKDGLVAIANLTPEVVKDFSAVKTKSQNKVTIKVDTDSLKVGNTNTETLKANDKASDFVNAYVSAYRNIAALPTVFSVELSATPFLQENIDNAGQITNVKITIGAQKDIQVDFSKNANRKKALAFLFGTPTKAEIISNNGYKIKLTNELQTRYIIFSKAINDDAINDNNFKKTEKEAAEEVQEFFDKIPQLTLEGGDAVHQFKLGGNLNVKFSEVNKDNISKFKSEQEQFWGSQLAQLCGGFSVSTLISLNTNVVVDEGGIKKIKLFNQEMGNLVDVADFNDFLKLLDLLNENVVFNDVARGSSFEIGGDNKIKYTTNKGSKGSTDQVVKK